MHIETQIPRINKALSLWNGATLALISFNDSMSNSLILNLFQNNRRAALKLCSCQYIQTFYNQNNVHLYCDKVTFEGFECFSIKDRNSKFKIIVGSSIHLEGD